MLETILKEIDQKADRAIRKSSQEKEGELVRMSQEHSQKLKQKKEALKSKTEQKAEQEIEEYKKTKERLVNFQIQQKRNEIIDRVYQETAEKAGKLAQPELEGIIRRLAEPILSRQGRFMAGERTLAVLRSISQGQKAEGGLKEEGFVFVSDQLEINGAFSQLLEQMREKANPQLVKILFA